MKIKIGDKAVLKKIITEDMVNDYVELLGDSNYVHTNELKAKESIFGSRVAHGMLVAGLISTVIGTEMPGEGAIYLEQNVKFLKPVYLGDCVTVSVEVSEIINSEKGIIKLITIIQNQKQQVTHEGYAVVKCEKI